MSPRSLLILAVMTSAALTGAAVAVMTHLQPATMLRMAQIAKPAAAAFRSAPQAGVQPEGVAPLFPPPVATPVAAPAAAPVAAPATTEPMTLHLQIRQAVRERNLTLLKSLMRAGALRGTWRELKQSEQVDFDNLDAAAWKILEKAVSCRQPAQTNAPNLAPNLVPSIVAPAPCPNPLF